MDNVILLQISESLQTLSSLIHTNEQHSQLNEKISSIMGECDVNNLESCIMEQSSQHPWKHSINHYWWQYKFITVRTNCNRLLYLTPVFANLIFILEARDKFTSKPEFSWACEKSLFSTACWNSEFVNFIQHINTCH